MPSCCWRSILSKEQCLDGGALNVREQRRYAMNRIRDKDTFRIVSICC